MNGLRATFEEIEQEELEATPADPADEGEITEEVAETALEVEEAAQEAEEAEQVVDELEETGDALEETEAALEAFIEEGGMDRQTAIMHHLNMQNIMRRLPLDSQRYIPSVESFDYDKLTATQEALDKVKDVLNRIWQAIKNAFSKMIAAVKNFFNKIGTSAKALKGNAQALIGKAKAASGEAKNAKMDAGSLAAKLTTGSSFSGDVAAGIARLNTATKVMADVSVSSRKSIKEALADIKGERSFWDKFKASIKKIFEQKLKGYGDLPGGRSIVLEGEYSAPKLASGEEYKGGTEISTPSTDEIVKIGEMVEMLADQIAEYSDKVWIESAKELDALIDGVKGTVDAAAKDEAKAAATKENLDKMTEASKLVKNIGPEFIGYAAQTAKHALKFGSLALKQY